jgi:putative transcriptional regulator
MVTVAHRKHGARKMPPDAWRIAKARERAGHSQSQAARVIYVSVQAWQKWEQAVNRMPPGLFELYLIKTGQLDLEDIAPATA